MDKNEAVTHFGEVVNAHPGLQKYQIGAFPFRFQKIYINHLPVPVTVGIRCGGKFTLPNIPDLHCNKFIARIEFMFDRRAANEFSNFVSTITEESSDELRALKEAYTVRVTTATTGGINVVLDYKLSMMDLQRRGGSVYFHEIDDVVSLLPLSQAPNHPHSEVGREKRATSGVVGDDLLNFYYEVEIIDNLGQLSDRFINIHNEVYRVSPRKDKNKRDGIYIVSTAAAFGDLGSNNLTQKMFALDSSVASSFLYSSYDEAKNHGDMGAARKEELTKLEHELALEKTNFAKLKLSHETQLLELDQKYKAADAERQKQQIELDLHRSEKEARAKLESQRMKDMFEARSYQRKDESEFMKHLPMMIMGIGAVLMAIKTFTGSK